jgi:hypothetical protein
MISRLARLCLALALGTAAAPSSAQIPPVAPAPAQSPAASPASAAPAAAQRYSIDTKFSVLFADPRAAEVVHAFFHKRRVAAGKPEYSPEERARMAETIADMTPREIAQYPDADLDDAALAELDALLAQVPYPAATSPSSAAHAPPRT